MPNVERVRCSWHVIERGWQENCPKLTNIKDTDNALKIIQNIKNWMYSWTLPCIENEQEYNVSKELFEKYIFSSPIVEVVGETFSKVVLNFFSKKRRTRITTYVLLQKKEHSSF